MKTYKQRKYSRNKEKQAVAIDDFTSDLRVRVSSLLYFYTNMCEYIIKNDGKVKFHIDDENWARVLNTTNSNTIFYSRNYVLDKIGIEEGDYYRNNTLSVEGAEKELSKNEMLLLNLDIINNNVDYIVRLILDKSVLEIPGLLTDRRLHSIRVMNGFIPTDEAIRNGSSYSQTIATLALSLYNKCIEEACNKVLNESELVDSNDDRIEELRSELNALEERKKSLEHELEIVNTQIENKKFEKAVQIIKTK